MRIWTEAYRPFIMGGDVRAPVITNVNVEGPFVLPKGVKVFVATAPNGKTFVVEAESGAMIGPNLEQVYSDIDACPDTAIMCRQIARAKKRQLRAVPVEPAEFWKLLKVDE